MKQSELAQRIGVAVVTIGQYERGKRQPDLEQLQRIASELGISLDYLLGLRPLPDDLAEVFQNREIGQNIKDLRKAAGLTQKEPSEKTGIPLTYLRSFESGAGGYFPTEDDLLRIAMVFGIRVNALKGTSVTQEWMLEVMERNKKMQEDDSPVKNITFNATPDPEWIELEKKSEDGTITPDEAQRYRDLLDQSMESTRRMIPKAKQRVLDLLEKLSDSELRVVTAMAEQMIAERLAAAPRSALSESEGKDTTPAEPPPESPEKGGQVGS